MEPQRLRAASALVVLVLFAGALLPTPAQGREDLGRRWANRHDFEISARSVRQMWTRERMRSAPPLILDQELRETSAQEAPFTRREIADPAEFPYRLHGKLFITAGRIEYHCSATALNGANESVVFTAGHCLYGEDIGGWADSVAFVPGYRFGSRPYGTWVAESAFVTPGWLSSETPRADIGALVMSPLDGSTLNDVIGGRSVAFGQERKQSFEVFGYPAAGSFNGERLYVCEASTYWRDSTPNGSGPDPMGIGCDMTQGSSGGGWVIDGTTLNSVNSYGYEDETGDDLPYMFGPYFGSIARSLYDQASAVPVAVPQPTPSATVTPTPDASPTGSPVPTPTPTPGASRRIIDNNDSRGLFDLSEVSVEDSNGEVTLRVKTYDEWRIGLLSDAYPRNFVFVDFDSFGDNSVDYYLAVFARNGQIVGRILQHVPGDDVIVGSAVVRRPSRRSLTATFGRGLLQPQAKLRWIASSYFKTPKRCATGCVDRAPNRGLAEL